MAPKNRISRPYDAGSYFVPALGNKDAAILLHNSGLLRSRPQLAFAAFNLIALSIEGYLKAYISHRGVSAEVIKDKIGHNIAKAYKMACGLGLSLGSVALENIINDLSDKYGSNQYRYMPTDMNLDHVTANDQANYINVCVLQLDHLDTIIQNEIPESDRRGLADR